MQPIDDVDVNGPSQTTSPVDDEEELVIMIGGQRSTGRRHKKHLDRNEVKRFVVVVVAAPAPTIERTAGAAGAQGGRRRGDHSMTLEQVLVNANCVMMLRRSNVVEDYNNRRRRHLNARINTPTDVLALGAPDNRRALPLCYVVGSNPVDRTNFALDHLQNFGNHSDLPSVVVQWPLWNWSAAAVGAVGLDAAPIDLAHCFLELLSYRIQSTFKCKWRPGTNSSLKLHVCVVLDDVDRRELIQFFSNPLLVRQYVTELQQSGVAESLMVVICGPNSVARKVNGAANAFVFRLP